MDKIGYFDTIDAVKRIIIQKEHKLALAQTSMVVKKYEGQVQLYKTILFYLEQCQKKTIKME